MALLTTPNIDTLQLSREAAPAHYPAALYDVAARLELPELGRGAYESGNAAFVARADLPLTLARLTRGEAALAIVPQAEANVPLDEQLQAALATDCGRTWKDVTSASLRGIISAEACGWRFPRVAAEWLEARVRQWCGTLEEVSGVTSLDLKIFNASANPENAYFNQLSPGEGGEHLLELRTYFCGSGAVRYVPLAVVDEGRLQGYQDYIREILDDLASGVYSLQVGARTAAERLVIQDVPFLQNGLDPADHVVRVNTGDVVLVSSKDSPFFELPVNQNGKVFGFHIRARVAGAELVKARMETSKTGIDDQFLLEIS